MIHHIRQTGVTGLLLGLVLLLGLQRAEGQHYNGRIRDRETARVVSGVEVLTMQGHRLAWTDGQGQFAFDYSVDSLRVILLADGYRQQVALLRSGQRAELSLDPRRTSSERSAVGGAEGVTTVGK